MQVNKAIQLFEKSIQKHLGVKQEEIRYKNEGEYLIIRGEST